MIKIAAPIIGGITCEPVEATDSIEAAVAGGIPYLFIRGIVKEPVPAALAAILPVNIPKAILPMTAV